MFYSFDPLGNGSCKEIFSFTKREILYRKANKIFHHTLLWMAIIFYYKIYINISEISKMGDPQFNQCELIIL